MAQHPIVIAHHLTWTLYGWWLPNDPRGSGSKYVANIDLRELGPTHYGRKSMLPSFQELQAFQRAAEQRLRFPRMLLKPEQFPVVAEAFGELIAKFKYTCWACAVMPDHVHLLIRKHKDLGEDMVRKLQVFSHQKLRRKRLIPPGHPFWTDGGYDGWIDEPRRVWTLIKYIDNNPTKIGLPRQHWPFVQPYDNWPLHEGHSPNSPYAKTLRKAGKYPSNS